MPTPSAKLASNRTLPPEQLQAVFEMMLRMRLFEQRTADLFAEGLVKGTAHSYVGQEAVAAAVCGTLRQDDYVASNHRGHGHIIAKGADLDRMMAELMGRRDGYCGGLGGSMHIADLDLGILGANGIVGAALQMVLELGLQQRIPDQPLGDLVDEEAMQHYRRRQQQGIAAQPHQDVRAQAAPDPHASPDACGTASR